ncbi:MAG: SUMF1/EgtB/PvdO family nonheme iron enzyme [Microcystis sp. M114S2]|jgi:formylglycine-generating enzyme required for sulfatase activity|uniref:SUMF1/EgtB/PvdO family nonheme iron enzyme n=1 Tax=unclassified Microcystis TaxID=2643300 RepID=UPI00258EA32C|nr:MULTISPECIES: SUMF1/EgtB/PvdO family nonheme iron enzyme [unclassified Microcystis]MCA2669187.1 SUMF1/EgtB/PvdO family nonheme iron enzyme [Microcystis sp. M045S2]MCA2715115.1 SUMF1/EgtB/PvdO family nonheme iron enzyme [Microcystis sp. M172S2]MCA2805276.1 SUMF1/EgtB/PvdO family nonheme iron enzyme [Microcystis sp. M114S2]MCA2834991.1 SUMF1/EgtB/PvdO family nonheme iron enzyme [Microcystis sp. M007S1]MCA2838374.1 SUMF1/EgtB/PvdO family nonheme iron enzyme [Microcystis sp. M078S1]
MEFDVFLCHNGQDKPEVKKIAETLKQQGLTPWLDEWELQPGLPWQRELEKQIQNIKSAAVFVGGSGIGPWQQMEIEAYLRRFVRNQCPVIPVLLSNAPEQPELPLFLEGMTWVDFRRLSPKPMERLIWGITGIKPRSPLELTSENSKTPNKEEQIKQILPVQSQTFTFETFTVNPNGKVSPPESKTARYYSEDLGNGITLEMVAIPGGTFRMGTEDEEIERLVKKFGSDRFRRERPQHEVTVPPFFMGKYPITQAQWKAIAATAKIDIDLETNPSNFKGDELPVERVNWYQATEFCKRLSRETKREYRLPSEAEWEYACRAGTTTPFYFGETITGELANYDASNTYAEEAKGEYREETTPVGQFPPNAFGLYDMHGNVWEWCADTWHDNYDGAPTDGSVWTENGNNNRSPMRGGSWYSYPTSCRSAYRSLNIRRDLNSDFGFRVVCGAGRTL